MLLPKGGVTWKSAKARLPQWRAVLVVLTRTRFLVAIALTGLIILLWRGISVSTSQMAEYANSRVTRAPCLIWFDHADTITLQLLLLRALKVAS
jgi:flagellar basal body-associated protein FliL